MALDGEKGALIRQALIQFGKNIKSDVDRTSPFNKNVNGRIVEVNPDGYTVEIQTRNYPNVKAINAQNLQVNDIVACCIPNNQMSQVYILGKLVGNISVSATGGTMTDMQVNGVSVVNNGVGNIATVGTYNATTNKIITESDIPAIEQSQSTSTTKVPSSNLLTQSSFAKVYRTLADLSSSLTSSSSLADICNAFTVNSSIAILNPAMNSNLAPSGVASSVGVTIITCTTPNRITVEYTSDQGERWLCGYHKDSTTLYPWVKVKADDATAARGVDANTNYAGYFKVAESQVPYWYVPAKARIYVHDIDSTSYGIMEVIAYTGNNGSTSGDMIGINEGNYLSAYKNHFFLVVRQDKSANITTKSFELWYHQDATYSRFAFEFLTDYANSRNATFTQKWTKYNKTSQEDQSYVSSGVVDFTNGFIPESSWGTSVFQTTDYPDVEIFNDNEQIQYESSYLAMKNTSNQYSDTPSSATNRTISFTDSNDVSVGSVQSVIGATWNALNFGLRSKGNVSRSLEFVHYPSSGNWNFDCLTDDEVNLGISTRRWKNLYVSRNISDGTNSASATNIVKTVCVCETAADTVAKTVTIPDYTLRNGNMISVYFVNANTVASPTLDINGTGAKPIYVDAAVATASNLTAGWHTFYYNGTNYYTGYSFESLTVGFASGTGQIRQNTNVLAGAAITANRLIYAQADNKYYRLTGSCAINTLQPILYANSAISSGATGSNNWSIRNQSAGNMLNNGTAQTVTAYAPVFLKGNLVGNTFTTLASGWWTQTIPTTADGYQYMLLGYAYSTTYIRLQLEHPIYAYIDGAFKPYVAGSTVNVSNSYPISSSSASQTDALSARAIYDGVVSEINAVVKYLHNIRIIITGISNMVATIYFSIVTTRSSVYTTMSQICGDLTNSGQIFGVSGQVTRQSSGTDTSGPILSCAGLVYSSGSVSGIYFNRAYISNGVFTVEQISTSAYSTPSVTDYVVQI